MVNKLRGHLAEEREAAEVPESHSLGGRTARNALWNVLPLVWSSVLGLITIPIVIKCIGMGHFGIYGLFAVLLAPLSLANLGFAEATIKYVAEYAHRGEFETCARFVRTTLLFNVAVGIIGGILIATLGSALAVRFFKISPTDVQLVRQCLVLVGITWAVNQASSVFIGIPPALQAFKTVAACQVGINTALAAASIAVVVTGFGLLGYTVANLFGSALGLAAWYGVSKRLIPGQDFRPRLDLSIWKRAFDFGVWRAVAQLGGLLASQAERFLLGVFLVPQAVGYYNVALNLEQRAYSVVYKMSEVLFPLFSARSAEPDERSLSLLLRATWLLTTLSVCVLMPMVGLARPLLAAWIDLETAQQAGRVLQLLALAGILGCASNAMNFYLLGSGRSRWGALLSVSTGLTIVFVAAWVLPRYGLRGAAVSAVASMLVQHAFIRYFMLRRLFGPRFKPSRVFVAFYAPVIVGLVLALLVAQIHFFNGWSLLPLLVAYAMLSLVCGLLIVTCHSQLPHGSEHIADVLRVLALLRQRLQLRPTPVCAG